MAVFAVYIEKEVSYFGGVKAMGNTYHFNTDPLEPFNDFGLAELVASFEKTVTSSDVTFKSWLTWGPTDGPEIDSIVRDSGLLTGTGSGPTQPGQYREACALVVWPMPRSPVLNRSRWLRKFIRMPAVPSLALSGVQSAGTSPLTAGQISEIKRTYAVPVMSPGAFGHQLCSSNGTEPNDQPIVRPYLFTRQIGR